MAYPEFYLEKVNTRVRTKRKLRTLDEPLFRPLASSSAPVSAFFSKYVIAEKRRTITRKLIFVPKPPAHPLAASSAPLTAFYNLPKPIRRVTKHHFVTPLMWRTSAATPATPIHICYESLNATITARGVSVNSLLGNDSIGLDGTTIC